MATMKSPAEILEAVVEDGRKELRRGGTGLAFSALAAGLNISFCAVALAVIGSLTGGIGLAAIAAYPIGFLIVVLGRAELYTENTVTPVSVTLTDHSQLPSMLRLWALVFVFNVIGALAFAFLIFYGGILSPAATELLLGEVATKIDAGFLEVTLKAVIGGWLVALIAWMVAASQDTISQIFFTWVLVLLIPAAGLAHCIAGSAEVFISVFSGATSWTEYLGRFLVPATLGNTIGGLVLVTLLNYGQVVGSGRKG